MSVDIASLAIKIDATQAEQGAKSLDKLTEAGGKAEGATNKVASSAEKLGAEGRKAMAATDQLGASIDKLIAAIGANTRAIELAAKAQMSSVAAATQAAGAQAKLAAGYEASNVAAQTVAANTNTVAAAQGKVGASATAAAAKVAQAGEAQIATAKRVAAIQISEQERVAAHQAAIASGALVKSVNPVNGVVSYGPVIKEATEAAEAVKGLTAATNGQGAALVQLDLHVQAYRQSLNQADAHVQAYRDHLEDMNRSTRNASIGILSMIGSFAGMVAVQAVIGGLTSALESARLTTDNAAASARGYADAMLVAEDAINGVAVATMRLADANKEAARQQIAKEVATNQSEINRLEKPTLGTRFGRALMPGYGDYLEEKDQKQAEALRSRNAALQAEGIRLVMSGNAAASASQREYTSAIKSALPHEAALAALQEQRKVITEGMKRPFADQVEAQKALAGLDKKEADLMKAAAPAKAAHTRAVREHTAALSDEARALIEATKAADRYIGSQTSQIRSLTMPQSQRTALDTRDQVAAAPRQDQKEAIQLSGDYLVILQQIDEAQKGIKPIGDLISGLGDDILATQIDELDAYIDRLRDLEDQTYSAANGMADAFGKVGTAIGGVLVALSDYAVGLDKINAIRDKANLEDPTKEAENNAKAAQRAAQLQIHSYGDMAAAAKGFFKEGSKGYRALETAEKAYRLFEFAMAVKSLFFKGAETAAVGVGVAAKVAAVGPTVAADAAVTASGVAAGAGKIFGALGPLGFPVVAAMLAVMAGIGFSKGGGASASVPISQTRQESQGTGSVLGDASAKSDSIAHSLELVEQHTNRDLEFSNSMVKSLRSIDNNISLVASSLAKQLGAGGAFDTSKLSLGTTSKLTSDTFFPLLSKVPILGGLLDGAMNLVSKIPVLGGLVKTLFGTKTKTTLTDQGLSFDPQSIEDILNNGISGSTYQDIQTKRSSKFFGISLGSKSKDGTVNSDLDTQLATQLALLVTSLRDGVLAAANTLGITGAEATLNAFQVELGKISLKDLDAAGVEDALNAVFSKLGDDMAGAVVPGLAEFQKAGEGLFETLNRVARDYQVVDIALASIGKTFGQVGLASVAARENLIDLVGGLDNLTELTQSFSDNFLTKDEQIAPVIAAVDKELTRLGLSGLTTRDAFKQVVLGLDVSTEAGAQMYASLLQVSPAFAKIMDYLDELGGTTTKTVSLTDQIAAAHDDLAKAYDKEASALKSTQDQFQAFADSLKKFGDSLSTGPNALLSPEAQYNASKGAFEATAAKARLGDATALGDLQGVSQAYLDASKAYYASTGKYFADLAAVKAAVQAAQGTAQRTATNAEQQLTALKAQVSGLLTVNDSVLSVKDAIDALTALMAQLPAAAASGGGRATAGFTGGAPAAADPFPAGWTAAGYLAKNADVMANAQGAVADGSFPSLDAVARAHWMSFGQNEGRAFANGGFHTGGLRMVGERGPELEATGPSRIWNAEQTRTMLGGSNDNSELVTELKALRQEVAALRQDTRRGFSEDVNAQERIAQRQEQGQRGGSTNRLVAGGRAP